MAAGTALQVTSGSGPYLALGPTYSEGGKTVADQKVILGLPYAPTYAITGSGVASLATAASHLIEIMAGASLNVRLRRLRVFFAGGPGAATLMAVQLVRLTSAGSGGVNYVSAALDPSDPAAGLSAFQLPTTKGAEGSILATAQLFLPTSLTTQQSALLLDWWWPSDDTKAPVIPAGTSNGLCLKNLTGVASAQVILDIVAVETPF